MSQDLQLDLSDELETDREEGRYGYRDGVLFIVDATEPMFVVNPDTKETFFAQCLQIYRNILAEKLSWNRQDWMGLILFGTQKGDTNPVMKNILTLQPLSEVTIEKLKEIEKILLDVQVYHKQIGSSKNYPLHDTLWHAARSFSGIKLTMPLRRVILLTCVDNPFVTNSTEKHRIRVKAIEDYNGVGLQLSVVGLGANWNADKFYKDVEVASGKFDAAEDFKRTRLEDLEEQVKHGARVTAKFPWRLGENVELGVSLCSISVKTTFPKKVRLSKDTNEPLEGYTHFQKVELEEGEDEEDENTKIVLHEEVRKFQVYGGRKIFFTTKEVRSLYNMRKPGIDLLGFKPQSKLDLTYHLEAPKFVSWNESELKGSKTLFAALLDRCAKRKVMAICALTYRQNSSSHLYALVPNIEENGFFAHKIPFKEDVRDLNEHLSDYIYDDTNKKCPINEEGVALCSQVIKKSLVKYDPTMFPNPRLHIEMANIEALAMDREERRPVFDSTLPNTEKLKERLGELLERFGDLVTTSARSREHFDDNARAAKRPGQPSTGTNKMAKLDVEELAKDKKLDKCNVIQLKEYLQSKGLRSSGRKADLVRMVYEHLNIQN